MSTTAGTSATAAGTRRLYPGLDQLVLRSTVVLGALGCLVSVQATGARPEQWQLLLALGLALLTALRPDSLAGVGLTLWVVVLWGLSPAHSAVPALGCAAGLVMAHVGALVASQGPVRMAVDVRQVLRWSLRAVALWLAAVTVWALGQLLAEPPGGGWAHAAGLVVLTLTAGVVTLLLRPGRHTG